ncbi:MAG: hypothetical protein IJP17_06760, partial [Clostridia bacterium]|nr:hypothetical protein [Clostridia bacterium]
MAVTAKELHELLEKKKKSSSGKKSKGVSLPASAQKPITPTVSSAPNKKTSTANPSAPAYDREAANVTVEQLNDRIGILLDKQSSAADIRTANSYGAEIDELVAQRDALMERTYAAEGEEYLRRQREEIKSAQDKYKQSGRDVSTTERKRTKFGAVLDGIRDSTGEFLDGHGEQMLGAAYDKGTEGLIGMTNPFYAAYKTGAEAFNKATGKEILPVPDVSIGDDVAAGLHTMYDTTFAGLDDYMTEDEIGTFNYLWETEGRKSANKYLDAIKSDLRQRAADANAEQWSDYASGNATRATIASIASVPQSVYGGSASFLGYVGQNIANEFSDDYVNKSAPVDYNMWASRQAQNSENIRGAVSDKYDVNVGNFDVFDFAYNGIMSTADSALAAVTPGDVGGLMLGSSAAASTARDLKARGASDDEAIRGGMAAGVFEALFESVSIGQLEAMKSVDVKTIKDVLKNTG